jgi:hypothetical protein
MSLFNYNAQVQIVVASMTIHNYIKRTSLQDVAFMEFDRYPDFVPEDFLTNVAPYSHIKKKATSLRVWITYVMRLQQV